MLECSKKNLNLLLQSLYLQGKINDFFSKKGLKKGNNNSQQPPFLALVRQNIYVRITVTSSVYNLI